jgi:predicted NBD/HSP70 family sugar kinase
MFEGRDAILAVDIGGTNIRVGVVMLNLKKAADLSKSSIWKFDLWRHGDEDDVNRKNAVKGLTDMIEDLIGAAHKEKIKLAPFIGIGCPGKIDEDGQIDRGAQNLPGNWESSRFHLPAEIVKRIPKIDDHDTAVVMHNDAVVQGLSEAPFMQDVPHWGALTIGTGLGNARFTNRGED